MKLKVELTEAEKRTLQQLSRKHPYQDFRTRGLGLLLLNDGRRICDIAEELEVSAKSVYNWAHAWHDRGLCGLLVGHKGGRPRALSDAMVTTAVEAARAESMTLKQIAQQIEAVHDVPFPCGLDTLSVALKRAGFSYKRGRYSLKKNETNRSSL
ncbi:helix-turn-helix domain-containing protein [Collimonas sp.]|uniref:helix-turn-helix domain-containing protein n=1 Tax=Collimonas sp. TaxID=1963772 RepID=UPI002C9E2C73|nr:helix-turn-helix domain-containing protein [Collimonas sp.]HWW99940.1 helix-turn-helix domain-containing protein [Collimonas sp.]